MLFEFELQPIEAVTPWGTPPDATLHWFGLTDGFYRLKVGDQYLLNYTDDIIDHWKQKYPVLNAKSKQTWIDYQVVRLWEDILQMLPHSLEPLPRELGAFLEKSDSYIRSWEDEIWDSDRNDEVFRDAMAWIGQRYLDSGHLNPAPSIKIWTENDEVSIKWDNRDCVIEGIPVWSAQQGIYRMPVGAFLQEVHSFHERLMGEMEERVAAILARKGIDSVDIDLKQLANEQEDRKKWLDNALSRQCSSHEIETALRILSENNFGKD